MLLRYIALASYTAFVVQHKGCSIYCTIWFIYFYCKINLTLTEVRWKHNWDYTVFKIFSIICNNTIYAVSSGSGILHTVFKIIPF